MICLVYFPCLEHFVPTPRTGRSVCPFLVIPSADQAVLASAKIGGNCLSQGQPAGIFLDQKGLSSLREIRSTSGATILCNGQNHKCTGFMRRLLVSFLWYLSSLGKKIVVHPDLLTSKTCSASDLKVSMTYPSHGSQ